MANISNSLKQLMQIPGNLGSALVDINTGLSVAQIGGRSIDLTTQAESYAQYMRVKEKTVNDIDLDEAIEEVVFTSSLHYHLLYPVKVRVLKVKQPENLFFFVALTKSEANLAHSRCKIKQIISEFAF